MPSAHPQPLPAQLVASVAREAERDADAVVAFLDAVEARSGDTWERPVRFPAAFLLGAGAALRLAGWEAAGLDPHRAAGLDAAGAVFRQVAAWCLELEPPERDRRVLDLHVKVLDISVNRFAWVGPAVLGARVLLDEIEDEDLLLEAIAEIAWKNRHKETDP